MIHPLLAPKLRSHCDTPRSDCPGAHRRDTLRLGLLSYSYEDLARTLDYWSSPRMGAMTTSAARSMLSHPFSTDGSKSPLSKQRSFPLRPSTMSRLTLRGPSVSKGLYILLPRYLEDPAAINPELLAVSPLCEIHVIVNQASAKSMVVRIALCGQWHDHAAPANFPLVGIDFPGSQDDAVASVTADCNQRLRSDLLPRPPLL